MTKDIVVSAREPGRLHRLLSLLGEWLEINIVVKDFGSDSQNAAQLIFCDKRDAVQFVCVPSIDRMVLIRGERTDERAPLGFADSPRLSPVLRAQILEECTATALPAGIEGEVLASVSRSPVWTTLGPTGYGAEFTTETLAELQPGQNLIDQLSLSRWTGLLPLILFLRRMMADEDWVAPPLRACFMFDDPNLHWPTYGFLDYRALIQHSKQRNYHAAIATIPLDGWFVHSAVARLFRENTAHLSLLVHGNNHTREELARPYDNGSRVKLVAQSLERIARFERMSKLSVARIMAAPHSACSAAMAAELLRQGFEAACISHELLRRFNSTTKWPASFGLEPAEFLSNGLPVIPRFNLSKAGPTAAIFAALLGQPIIPFCHHQDAADELQLLEKTSEKINQLGEVRWCNLVEIARTNYKHRVWGKLLQVKMYSRQIDVEVPPEIETGEIFRAWEKGGDSEESLEKRMNGDSWTRVNPREIVLPQHNGTARMLELRWVPSRSIDYRNVPSPSLHPWGIVRRLLTEARDRCYLYRE
jgi:hypothetical protein